MKPNLKTSIKKIATLMLAVLSLAALLSMMPEHSRAYHETQAKASKLELIAQN